MGCTKWRILLCTGIGTHDNFDDNVESVIMLIMRPQAGCNMACSGGIMFSPCLSRCPSCCLFHANIGSPAVRAVLAIGKLSEHCLQGDHLYGKPGNVREFDSCQGNFRDIC